MIGKLIIIGIIVIALAILISNSKLFQNVPSLDSIKNKIDHATSDKHVINASESTLKETSMGGKIIVTNSSTGSSTTNENSNSLNTTPTTVYQLGKEFVDEQNYTGQVFGKTGNVCEISVPAMAQNVNEQKELTHIIQLGSCILDVGDPVHVIAIAAKPNAPLVNPSTGLKISSYSKDSDPILPSYYNEIKLKTINQGNNTMINFIDSSDQTKSVTVVMRNSNKTLFTGTFYSAKFTTEIKNVSNIPYIIEMTIDNTIYGKLHASAYSPTNLQNSTITGIVSIS